MAESSSSSSGIGFFGLLTILFIGLKLTDHIDWSWWWVLAPFWVGVVALLLVFLVMLIWHGWPKKQPTYRGRRY